MQYTAAADGCDWCVLALLCSLSLPVARRADPPSLAASTTWPSVEVRHGHSSLFDSRGLLPGGKGIGHIRPIGEVYGGK